MQRRQFQVVVAIVIAIALAGAGVKAAVLLRHRLASALASSSGSGDSGSAGESGAAGRSGGHTATPTPAPYRSPLTGKKTTQGRPVLAVKIDNVSPARPQTGLPDADVVYVEPVEGGLSRIMAIFSSHLPDSVGPVRSARESDLEVLAQYGHPALAFSGANGATLRAIAAAPVTDLSPNRKAAAYRRSTAKAAPHNLFADPVALLKSAQGVSAAQDIGFRFGAIPAGLGTAATSRTVRYGAATTKFSWSKNSKQWLVSFDGTPATSSGGTRLSASTVVIQNVSITSSGLHDVLGNATPFTNSIGGGTAVVLRGGVSIPARWSRPSASAGTTFTTENGGLLPFAAGQVWVVYAPE